MQNTEEMTTAQEQAVATLETSQNVTVTDATSLDTANEILRGIKKVRKEVKGVYRPILDRMNAQKNETMAEYKKYDEPLKEAEGVIKTAVGGYLDAQERIRQAAEHKAEAERKKLEDERLAEAKLLEDIGDTDAAAALVETPVEVTAPVPAAPKSHGISSSKRWSANVTDLMALVKAVAAGEAPLRYLKADQVRLNGIAADEKERFSVPGVEAVSKTVVSSRV